MPLTETDIIRIRQFLQRMESGLVEGMQVYATYHDSNLAAVPSDPTGDGTTGGWHRLPSADTNWMSVKTAFKDTGGTWGTPIRVFGLMGTETAGVGISADIPKLEKITFIGDGASKVGWTAGTVTYNGSSYAIAVKAVGDGSTDAYIYWDDADGQTSFKTTTSYATAIAPNHWMVCINDSGKAIPAVSHRIILGGLIQANSVTASDVVIAGTVTSTELSAGVNSDIAQGIADAAAAQAELDDISDDAKITPVEKLYAKRLWDTIVIEGTPTTGTIPAQAIAFGVSISVVPDWIGIDSSHLDSQCHAGEDGKLLTEALNGTDWWKHWDDENPHWFILDMGVAKHIKKVRGRSKLVDADPTKVDIYVSNDKENWGAAVATDISTWQDRDDWDGNAVIDVTPKNGQYVKVEVVETEQYPNNKMLWGGPVSGHFKIIDVYGGISDDFDISYAALDTYLNTTLGVFNDMEATTTVVRSEWDNAWKNYFDERTQILNDIVTAAKTIADSKVNTFYQDSVPTALNAGDIWYDTNDGLKMHRATNAGDDEVKAGEWEHVDLTIIDGGNITLATILAASISTYALTAANATIEGAFIKTAHIDDLQVTTLKIANDNVTTGKIADDATRIFETASTATETAYLPDAWTTVQTLAITSVGGILVVGGMCIVKRYVVGSSDVYVALYAGAAQIAISTAVNLSGIGDEATFRLNTIDVPGSGSTTYYLKVSPGSADTCKARSRELVLDEPRGK